MMKKTVLFLCLLVAAGTGFAQRAYEVMVERPKEKTYKGIISREIILADTSFRWFAENQKGYRPYPSLIGNLKTAADSIELMVFMGTWCEDSHFVIPKLFAAADSAGFPINHITLLGVDRNKKSTAHFSEALGINNVPTIIVFRNGKEYGRVVEFGKTGLYDKDLYEILETAIEPVTSK